jgi:hypothetical protein
MRGALKALFVVAAIAALPSLAYAQGTLTGTVKDDSGAVLPGVTVEAASPALIEKTRDAVTDGTGQYRIVDLAPGTYSLTFTLPGFTTVKREGITLAGTATLTIPVSMKVGGVQETITVSGETPVVDVQSTKRELVLDTQVIQEIPATRAAGALLNAVPGIEVSDAGLAAAPTMTSFHAHSSTINAGSVGGEGRYAINGFPLTAARSGGFSSYVYDTVNAEEIAVSVGGGLGEQDIGGPLMNIIPKSGGNDFSGNAFLNTAGKWSKGDNLSSDITALNPNIKAAPGILSSYDWSASLGGPIKRDRLWFFGGYRDLNTSTAMEGIVANKYAGDASHWDWAPDPVEGRLIQGRTMYFGRVAGQFGKSRVRFNTEYQARCEGTPLSVDTKGCNNRGADWIGLGNNSGGQQSPEATSTASRGYFDVPMEVTQGTWTMAANNKVLLEAGVNFFRYQPIFGQPPPDGITDLIAVTEQSNAVNPATGIQYAPVANYRYRAVPEWGPAHGTTNDGLASLSYVTGANSAKIGYEYRLLDLQDDDKAGSTLLAYRFNKGVPNQVTYYLPEMGRRTITQTHSIYVQDSWTRDKLTLQGALRWDRASSYAPVEGNGTFGQTSFLNPEPITIQKTVGVNAYNDLSPRFGAAYDVFGNGKTAIKFNWGRYLAYAANDAPYTSTNPGATIQRNANRSWTDADGDYVVDCDLLNASANGECEAAVGPNATFGQPGAATLVSPEVLSGWAVRPHDNDMTVTLQQQIAPRVSGEFSYTHRRWHGFFVNADSSRSVDDFESYTLTAPADSRLPDGGAYPITVLVPKTAGASTKYYTNETDFGSERKSTWDGFDITFNARLSQGLTAQVGTSTGRAFVDSCDTATNYVQLGGFGGSTLIGPDPRGCHNVEPWQTTIRGLASYTVPKIDVLVSTVIRSQPPLGLTATWSVPNSVILGALGHLPPGASATGRTNIPITDNEHRLYANNRRTQVDMRFAKIVRFGKTRTNIGVDLSNLLNTNYATAYNSTYLYGTDDAPRPAGWGTPTGIYTPRFVRLNFTFDF